MSSPLQITTFLAALRGDCLDSDFPPGDTAQPIIREVFSCGNCGNLAVMLAIAFGGKCVRLEDEHHYVCEIGNRLYDIDGDVTNAYRRERKTYVHWTVVKRDTMYSNYSWSLRGPIIW